MEKINHLYTHKREVFLIQRKEGVGCEGRGVVVGEQLAPDIQDVVVLQIRGGRGVC